MSIFIFITDENVKTNEFELNLMDKRYQITNSCILYK